MNATKVCSKCKQEFSLTSEFFYTDKRSKNGFNCACKECVKNTNKKWRQKNPEKRRELLRRWRAANPNKAKAMDARWHQANLERRREQKRVFRANNPEVMRERQRHFRATHPGYDREYARQWRAEHPERAAEIKKRFRKKNPEKVRVWNRRRHARKKGAEGFHTAEDVKQQIEIQNGLCCWCMQAVGEEYTVDHLIALNRKGSDGAENIVIACSVCNSSKNDHRVYFEWLPPFILNMLADNA